jgi:hypothetical protein
MCFGAIILLTGATSLQPKEERQAQSKLPQINEGVWQILAKNKVHLDEAKGLYSVIFTQETKDLDKTEVTIKGFMLPLDSTEKFTHFILSTRTPTCYFCPPGGPTEIIDVTVNKPISWNEDVVTVKGTFGFMKNEELGLFFKLENAIIVN